MSPEKSNTSSRPTPFQGRKPQVERPSKQVSQDDTEKTLQRDPNPSKLKKRLPRGVPVTEAAVAQCRMEEALRENEERLRTLSDNLPDGMVYQIDSGEDGRGRTFSYMSAGVDRLHHVTMADALKDATTIYGQVVEEDRLLVAEHEEAALAAMTPFSAEIRFQLPSGEIRWGRLASAPRRLPNGHLVWDGVEIDITDRKRTEEALRKSEELYRVLVETSPDAICLLNEDLQIAMANRRAVQLMGVDGPDELVGKTWLDFLSHSDIEMLKSRLRLTIPESFSQKHRLEVIRKDGARIPVEVHVASVVDSEGHPMGMIAVARNISERERLEREILEVRDREQERIGQDLHDGVCSHLAGVAFMADTLARDLHPTDTRQAKNAGEISSLIRHAVGLVRTVSKGLSPLSKRPDALVKALGDLTQTAATRFKIAFSFECGKTVNLWDQAKAIHLYRIAQEALNNAMTHAHPQRVSVRLSLDGPDGRLEIEDDGIGIPGRSERTRGTGLNIMEQRSRLVNGSLRVDSSPHRRGTLVCCQFPLSPPPRRG